MYQSHGEVEAVTERSHVSHIFNTEFDDFQRKQQNYHEHKYHTTDMVGTLISLIPVGKSVTWRHTAAPLLQMEKHQHSLVSELKSNVVYAFKLRNDPVLPSASVTQKHKVRVAYNLKKLCISLYLFMHICHS